jgi:NADH:ubiquinone oxidoreductase subunit F (NADH-binding)
VTTHGGGPVTTLAALAPPTGDRRLFAAPGPGLAEHVATYGPLPGRVDLAALLEEARLAGRGGAGFPSARKVRGVAARGRAVVVGNAAEGEPSSAKDATLIMAAPHLVIDGLVLAARAVGARETYVATSRHDLATHLRSVIDERKDLRRVTVIEVPDRFVSGQESALVNAINGNPPVPSDRLVPVFERGVHRRPTLVHNIETLAHMALLARYGAAWFRSVGTAEEPGTFLATVSGAVSAPSIFETAFGTPLSDLLEWAGSGPRGAQAVLIGGFHGTWVPGREIPEIRMTTQSLRSHGATLGAGVVAVLGRDRCGLTESAAIAAYLATESVGQCGPCINGLPRMADALGRLARHERSPWLVDEVHRMRFLVAGRGACAHPDGTARFVASTMRVFGDEVAVHLGGRCSVPSAR